MENRYNDKVYTAICSERTLQTNSNGFFINFVHTVSENAGEKWIKNVFGKLNTDKERIRIIYDYEGTKDPIIEVLSNVQEIYRKKSAEISQVKRLEGEKLLKDAEFKKSLILFSQSVLRAPKTGANTKIDCGVSLSLALWGRSQVLIALKEYSLALADIQFALKENLPNVYKPEAYWKMGICYKALNEENRANVSFNLAEKLLNSQKKKGDLERDRNTCFKENKQDDRRVIPLIEGKSNSKYPCASEKLSVNHKEGLGRFVTAKKQIKTGETLVVESPYAACLLPDMFGTHCHHCFDRLVSPIGCSDCSNVAFCKHECRDAALSSYHKYECKFLDLLLGSGMSILSHIALRMITQHELRKSLEIYTDRSKEKVYSLCTNSGMRNAEDFLQRTLMAAFLLRSLQKSGYFGQTDKDRLIPSDEEYCIGEMLLVHLQILQFNAHEIYETRHAAGTRFKGSKAAYIGVAIYPTAALFNHDCYPAVTRHFVGTKIVIRALRPLQPQDVVAENYGPIFTRKCLPDRQRSLSSRYWFNCKCSACNFNWPTLEAGLDDFSQRVKCPTEKCQYYFTLPVLNENVTCPKCGENVSLSQPILQLKRCEEQYDLGFTAMDSDEVEKAIGILCAALDVFHRISCPPHKGTHLAQETLQLCVADSGNKYETLVKK